ncbi:hypothetical protein [Clostridia bacterium UC5.1-1D1]|uniref:hypothetical protein n=1 Tax=Agathobaculum massiliense TaxID=3014267 RepID=UPI00128F5964
MKIRLFCASAALLLACLSPMQAAALAQEDTSLTASSVQAEPTNADATPTKGKSNTYLPVDIQVSADGLACRKIYDVPKDTSPDQIPQDDFDRGDMHYTFQDMLRIEMPDIDRKMHSETVTVSSTSDNSNDVMALLPKSKAVTTDDGYSGTAYLDVSSISTKIAGTESISEELSATREYPNMPEMDMTDIPKTVEDNGHTLTFSDIEWTEDTAGTDNIGTVETSYTAVVTYTGTATSSRTTGYTVTATYAGEVSHRNNDCIRYIAVYSGAPIVIEPEDNTEPPDLTGLLPEQEAQPDEGSVGGIRVSWVLCVVFGVLTVIFALRPPACGRMVEQMQAMAAQAGGKIQQGIRDKEMKKREKQKQKQAEDEKLRQAQHIFGPLEKIKAAIRSRRQRKAEQRAMLLAAPADDEWLDEDEEETGGSNDGQDEAAEAEDTAQASPQDRPVRNDSAGDDEYPGLSS